MKTKRGIDNTNTPPNPYSTLDRLTALSRNTVFLSKVPSLSASSKIRMRSFPSFASAGSHFGYERHSTTHILPRSSNVIDIGCTTSGSPANRVALNPGGNLMAAAASFGGNGPSAANVICKQVMTRMIGSQKRGIFNCLSTSFGTSQFETPSGHEEHAEDHFVGTPFSGSDERAAW